MMSALGLLFIFYQLAMLYGVGYLAVCYCMTPPRGISTTEFMIFGLWVPVGVWLFSLYAPAAALLMPLSLGYLFVRSAVFTTDSSRIDRAELEEKLRLAEEGMAADPKNAAAVLAKAEVLETKGRLLEALALYEKTHELSDRTLSALAFNEVRERLEEKLTRDPAERKDSWTAQLPAMAVEIPVLIVALAVFPWHWVFGMNLASVMAFVCWCKACERTG